MTVSVSNIIQTATLTTSSVTYYTTPAATRAIIDKMSVTNVGGAAATVTVNFVNGGGVANAGNAITSGQSVGAGVAYNFPEVAGHVLEPGQFIAVSSSGGSMNLRASGRVVT